MAKVVGTTPKQLLRAPWKGASCLAGANPVQQLTLRLVAARAVHGGNDMG